jgi:hypothetical protein
VPTDQRWMMRGHFSFTQKETRYEAGFFLNAIVATLVC